MKKSRPSALRSAIRIPQSAILTPHSPRRPRRSSPAFANSKLKTQNLKPNQLRRPSAPSPAVPAPLPPSASSSPPSVSPVANLSGPERQRCEELAEFYRQAATPRRPAELEAEIPASERISCQQHSLRQTHTAIRWLFANALEDPSPEVAADATACVLALAFAATASLQRLLREKPEPVRQAARRLPFFPLLCAKSKKILAENRAAIASLPIGADTPLPFRDEGSRGRPLVEDALSEHIRITCFRFHYIRLHEAEFWSQNRSAGFALERSVSQLLPLGEETCRDWARLVATWTLREFPADGRPAWLLRLLDPKSSRQRNLSKRVRRIAAKAAAASARVQDGLTAILHRQTIEKNRTEALGAANRDAVSHADPAVLLTEKIHDRLCVMLAPDSRRRR